MGTCFAVSDRFLRVHSAVFGDSSTAHTWLPGTSLTNGQPDRAGAGAQIDHARMDHAVSCQPVKAGLHHGFGFRTRNEHSGTDLQVKVAERSMPGDVLQRLALGTAVEHGTEDGKDTGDAVGLPQSLRDSPHKQRPCRRRSSVDIA